jgi:hypothetical protein
VRVKRKLAISVTVGLLAIGGQKVCASGPQIAADVLYSDRDAVVLYIEELRKVVVTDLRHGPVRRATKFGKLGPHVGQVLMGEIRHGSPSGRRNTDVCAST